MVIDIICKMTVKGVKLKSESFFSISYNVLELWRKYPKGGGFRSPGLDRVNPKWYWVLKMHEVLGEVDLSSSFPLSEGQLGQNLIVYKYVTNCYQNRNKIGDVTTGPLLLRHSLFLGSKSNF